ncbi:MAG: hypothetical protein RQ866_06205 [Bacteroidales bacterium]|nr:hypothetical protein [Bacteroidales bacterium]
MLSKEIKKKTVKRSYKKKLECTQARVFIEKEVGVELILKTMMIRTVFAYSMLVFIAGSL